VAFLPGERVAFRDSKRPGGPVLIFPAREWQAFTSAIRAGEFA
jgi:hypothetical protein